jgi:Protein of unknown function (DUF1569)
MQPPIARTKSTKPSAFNLKFFSVICEESLLKVLNYRYIIKLPLLPLLPLLPIHDCRLYFYWTNNSKAQNCYMKNLFEPIVKEEILLRIEKLSSDSKARWGKMNVNQAMRHMAMSFDIATGKLDPTPVNVPKMPKWLMKFFLLKIRPPKGKAETFKEMNTVELGINPADFEAEKNRLKQALAQFYNSSSLIPENKIAGKLSRADWGRLNYNHTDHHLRQFGV